MDTTSSEQVELPAVYMRGGTSKGVFFHQRDLPPPGAERDRLLLSLMGSPDPMQIDGLGGSYSSTSKVMVVARSAEPDVDISYWFAQVGVEAAIVDWSGNCGNLTTAIGPFAIDEGLHPATAPVTEIRLKNENTGVHVTALVPILGRRARVGGTLRVPGVPHPGAPIVTSYLDPGGGVLGTALPTGLPRDAVQTDDGEVTVSILDITHPCAFVRASDIGLHLARISPAELNADDAVLRRLEDLRAACSVLVKAAATPGEAATRAPSIPRLVIVDTDQVPTDQAHGGLADIRAIGLSMGKVHHALPMTAALCLAAAAAIPGTMPWEITRARGRPGSGDELAIRHPKGVVSLTARVAGSGTNLRVHSVGVARTARRLMTGSVFVRPAP